MDDLTQQRINEYEQYLIELIKKLQEPDPILNREQRFQNATVLTMSTMVNAEEFGVNYFRLERSMRELTSQYRKKIN